MKYIEEGIKMELDLKDLSETAIRIFIATFNIKMKNLFWEDWGSSTDPDHEPILTRWLYDGAIKEAFEETMTQIGDNLK